MPYITEERRRHLTGEGGSSIAANPCNAGELNFILTMVVLDYLQVNGISYQTFNDISGALTECLAEFRRRVVRPYEDVKAIVNGDVYAPLIAKLADHLNAELQDRE